MRLPAWLRWRTDEELDEEIHAHLDLDAQVHMERGLTPDQARQAALGRFGSPLRVKESTREGDVLFRLETFVGDLLYGWRSLRRQPGFAVAAAVSLALGIAGNTVVFSLIDSTLLKPLPFPDSDRLVMIWNVPDRSRPDQLGTSSIPRYVAFRDRSRSFESMAAFNGIACGVKSLGSDQDGVAAERIYGQTVAPAMFKTLGVAPLMGRVFTEDEDRPDEVAPVVLLSHRTWQRRFGSDPAIVGRNLTINRVPTTVIGVTPPGFTLFGEDLEFFAPLCLTKAQVQSRFGGNSIIARLNRGTSIAQAQAELDALAEQLAASEPELHRGLGVHVESLRRGQARLFDGIGQPFDYGSPLWTLQGAVAFVLLIACANVAGLLLARSTGRRKEIALRVALGAGRWRLVRQMVTESLPLAALGGVVGVFLSWVGLAVFLSVAPPDFPGREVIAIDLRVLAFTAVVVLVTSVLFALLPAIQVSGDAIVDRIHESNRGATGHARRQRLRRVLAVGQVGLAVVLLVGAGLMIRSFIGVIRQDLGADPKSLLTFELRFPLNDVAKQSGRYKGASLWDVNAASAQTFDRVLERLRQVPEVESAAGVNMAPFGGGSFQVPLLIEGRAAVSPGGLAGSAPDLQQTATYLAVTPEFFTAMRIPLLQGRDFDARDSTDRPPVVIVNRTLARRYFPDESPIGKRITLDFVPDERPREVIAVVGDMSVGPLISVREPIVYVPQMQQAEHATGSAVYTRTWMNFVLRTGGGDPMRLAPAVKRAVAEVDRHTPIAGLRTVEQSLDAQVRHLRVYMLLLGVFGAVAAVLAATGIYGLMAYSVAERTREIGIRMALGARSSDVLSMVLRQASTVVGVGVVIGLGAAFGLARLIRSVLVGVAPTDIATYAAVSIVLVGVGAIASLVPSHRAVSVDPTVALKEE